LIHFIEGIGPHTPNSSGTVHEHGERIARVLEEFIRPCYMFPWVIEDRKGYRMFPEDLRHMFPIFGANTYDLELSPTAGIELFQYIQVLPTRPTPSGPERDDQGCSQMVP